MKQNKKPFVRYIRLSWGEDIAAGISETFSELGYDLYESPIPDRNDSHAGVFISNVPLTEGWLYKNYRRFNLQLRGWVPTDKDAELELRTW